MHHATGITGLERIFFGSNPDSLFKDERVRIAYMRTIDRDASSRCNTDQFAKEGYLYKPSGRVHSALVITAPPTWILRARTTGPTPRTLSPTSPRRRSCWRRRVTGRRLTSTRSTRRPVPAAFPRASSHALKSSWG
jgi:hypothetical protein